MIFISLNNVLCRVFGVRSHFEHRGGCLLDRGDCDAWVDRPLAMIFISLNVLCRVFGVRSHFEHRGGYLLDRDDCGAWVDRPLAMILISFNDVLRKYADVSVGIML